MPEPCAQPQRASAVEAGTVGRLVRFAHERDACVTISRTPTSLGGGEWVVEILWSKQTVRGRRPAAFGNGPSLPGAIAQALAEALA